IDDAYHSPKNEILKLMSYFEHLGSHSFDIPEVFSIRDFERVHPLSGAASVGTNLPELGVYSGLISSESVYASIAIAFRRIRFCGHPNVNNLPGKLRPSRAGWPLRPTQPLPDSRRSTPSFPVRQPRHEHGALRPLHGRYAYQLQPGRPAVEHQYC